MINEPLHFGKVLEKYLKKNNISVIQFSKQMDINREYVYTLFKKPLFPMELTLRICDLFKLPLTFFIKINDPLNNAFFDEQNRKHDCREMQEMLEKKQQRIDQQTQKIERLQDEISTLKDRIIEMLDK